MKTTALICCLALSAVTPEGPVVRADVYDFTLRPTSRARGATASGILKPPQSPFGIAVNHDGYLAYDLELTVRGLRPARTLGGSVYSVWIATPELDRTEKLGNLPADGVLRVPLTGMNKFIFMVTAEGNPDAETRSGPIVLRGVSPSGLLAGFGSHELFSTMPHE